MVQLRVLGDLQQAGTRDGDGVCLLQSGVHLQARMPLPAQMNQG